MRSKTQSHRGNSKQSPICKKNARAKQKIVIYTFSYLYIIYKPMRRPFLKRSEPLSHMNR